MCLFRVTVDHVVTAHVLLGTTSGRCNCSPTLEDSFNGTRGFLELILRDLVDQHQRTSNNVTVSVRLPRWVFCHLRSGTEDGMH